LKYSDAMSDWLIEEGYTHCFFVAGGNIMHLLNSVRGKFTCVPFVHEFGAAVAAEYFTATSGDPRRKAFVLVTAGPGFTNTLTAIASAWTESRELLVIGGQVKSSDLSRGEVRQRGIQEINGLDLAAPICKAVLQIDAPVAKNSFIQALRIGSTDRKGPIFIEICLDAQGAIVDLGLLDSEFKEGVVTQQQSSNHSPEDSLAAIKAARRPVLLIGGGCDYSKVVSIREQLSTLGIPIMTTWNGSDRISSEDINYFGRPNTWGQRYSNVILQQSDLLIAVGTRLGIQQTGFAWEEFIPMGEIIQIDIDEKELSKGHPKVQYPIQMDSIEYLEKLVSSELDPERYSDWLLFCREIQNELPTVETVNVTGQGFIDPFKLMAKVSSLIALDAVVIPCSSGGAFTSAMQSFDLRGQQRMLTNKGMASMGYGLSGAIGASLAHLETNTYLFEGDGGFAQNIQELGTMVANSLPIKIFVLANSGYASIRMTQRNYFNGAWVGCDAETGLGLPDWELLAASYKIPYVLITPEIFEGNDFAEWINQPGPAFFEIPTDPEQTYFPKIASKVLPDGSMRSNPIHEMEPALTVELKKTVFKYLDQASKQGEKNEQN
jgi:acetolactate synthase I/II/III large subunit